MGKILLPGNLHIINPNIPRQSRHQLIRPKRFTERFPISFSEMWEPLQSICLWRPVFQDYQLIHAFNGIIPYTKKPWIVTYEVLLPYLQSDTNLLLKSLLQERLARENCRKILALSNYAKRKLIHNLKDWKSLKIVQDKLEVVRPNFPTIASQPKTYQNAENLTITFVGNRFGRKGGFVALRLAKKAQDIGLPITVHIVSALEYSTSIWIDFAQKSRYQEDLKLLNLNNVVFHGQLPNKEVISLLSQSHFQILPTLHDTYGYSVVEGFSVATPAITTNICALPEFVLHNENGYLLNLPLQQNGEWKNLPNKTLKNNSEEYWDILNKTYDDLAEQILQLLVNFRERSDKREHYQLLSAGALSQIQNQHNSQKANDILDNIYSEAIEN